MKKNLPIFGPMERGFESYVGKFTHHGCGSKMRVWQLYVKPGNRHHFTLGFWGGAEQDSGDWEGARYGLTPWWFWGMRGIAEVEVRPMRRVGSVKKCVVRWW